MAARTEELRDRAAECARLAAKATDTEIKRQLFALAMHFRELAELIDEKGARGTEAARARARAAAAAMAHAGTKPPKR